MRVLVSVASKHGATAEIGRAIALELRSAGLEAVESDPDEVLDVELFDAAVIGSAVYAGHWLEKAKRLIERERDRLVEMPVWLFSSGPVGAPLKPADEAADATLAARIGAREHRTLPGRIDRSGLGFAERAIVAALRVPDGDSRDWDAVRDWAREIARSLTGVPVVSA